MKNFPVLCVIKVLNLEIALCSMQGMIWGDTDALCVGIYMYIYILLNRIYFHTNELMLLNQNNFSVFKNIEMLHHIILSHCIPVRDSLFISVSV